MYELCHWWSITDRWPQSHCCNEGEGRIGWSSWCQFIYVLCSLLRACWALCVPWTNFCFNRYIYARTLVLVEHFVSSVTNNAWTAPLAVHSWPVATKLLMLWGGRAHWIVFMTSLCTCWALCVSWTEFACICVYFQDRKKCAYTYLYICTYVIRIYIYIYNIHILFYKYI